MKVRNLLLEVTPCRARLAGQGALLPKLSARDRELAMYAKTLRGMGLVRTPGGAWVPAAVTAQEGQWRDLREGGESNTFANEGELCGQIEAREGGIEPRGSLDVMSAEGDLNRVVDDRPILVDLFCCQGGASMGYHMAGFRVIGVDINPQPHYPFEFIQHDITKGIPWVALSRMGIHRSDIRAFHASPPCQRYSKQTPKAYRDKHPDLIDFTRQLLAAAKKPYIIENVEDARKALRSPIKLCGTGLGLKVQRHRYFELGGNFDILLVPPCQHDIPVVYMSGTTGNSSSPKGTRREASTQEVREASGIYLMTRKGLDEAIPPAFTKFIGDHLMRYIKALRVRAFASGRTVGGEIEVYASEGS